MSFSFTQSIQSIIIDLKDYNQRLVDLARKWRTGCITDAECYESDSSYRSLGDTPLGPLVEMAVDSLEYETQASLR